MRLYRSLSVFLLLILAVSCRPSAEDAEEADDDYFEDDPALKNDYNGNYGDLPDNEEEPPEIPKPTIISTPERLIAAEKETVHLPCEVQNGQQLVFWWRKNNELIFQDQIRFQNFGEKFHLENQTLVISNVSGNETADYTCSIPLSGTETVSVTHHLDVRTAPRIVSLKTAYESSQISPGEDIVITCKAEGFPKPTIKWSRAGKRLPTESETLIIKAATLEDSGDYQCLADNHVNPPAHLSTHISIVYAPAVKLEKVVVNSAEGQSVDLTCNVDSIPDAIINWKKDDRNIITSSHTMINHAGNTSTLRIERVEPHDFGVYTCSATNRVGKDSKDVALTELPTPPQFHRTHMSDEGVIVVFSTDSFAPILEHNVRFKSKNAAEWDSVNADVMQPNGHTHTFNYIFKDLQPVEYEIQARSRNTYGWSAFSKTAKFNGHTPLVTSDKAVVNTAEQYEAELICHVDAKPEAKVTWSKDGARLRHGGRYHFSVKNDKYTLRIEQVQSSDLGTYTCSAHNRMGSAEQNISLTTLPTTPRFLKGYEENKAPVLVWRLESKSPVIEHEFLFKKVGQAEWKSEKPQIKENEDTFYEIVHTLEGLEEGEYEAKVRSKNSHGWSDFSETKPFKGQVSGGVFNILPSLLLLCVTSMWVLSRQ